MADTTLDHFERGYPSLMRRDRLERIANAERDRRAGRIDVAIASIGEPVEWPARAVLVLARLGQGEVESRRLLVEGLDIWARDVGVGELDAAAPDDDDAREMQIQLANFAEDAALLASAHSSFHASLHAASLDTPLDLSELDRAFEEAETEVESMHHVNDVAERVLMNEPIGFAELAGDDLTPSEASDRDGSDDFMGIDAAFVEPRFPGHAEPLSYDPDSAAFAVGGEIRYSVGEVSDIDAPRQIVLATLESWLRNLARRRAGRAL